jgi:hypothetical protein
MKIPTHLIAAALLAWPTTAARAADDPSPEPNPAVVTSSSLSTERFEGYQYMDVDGKPLPFQSDEEIVKFIATAEVVDSSLIGTGITIPRKLVLRGEGFRAHAIFKDVDVERHKVRERVNGRTHFSLDWFDSHRFDSAAYTLDRLLGMDRMPPSAIRSVGG